MSGRNKTRIYRELKKEEKIKEDTYFTTKEIIQAYTKKEKYCFGKVTFSSGICRILCIIPITIIVFFIILGIPDTVKEQDPVVFWSIFLFWTIFSLIFAIIGISGLIFRPRAFVLITPEEIIIRNKIKIITIPMREISNIKKEYYRELNYSVIRIFKNDELIESISMDDFNASEMLLQVALIYWTQAEPDKLKEFFSK
ncbi:MAG: hypothetical protein ACFFAS_04990 [Promethearchaeota archaeon]